MRHIGIPFNADERTTVLPAGTTVVRIDAEATSNYRVDKSNAIARLPKGHKIVQSLGISTAWPNGWDAPSVRVRTYKVEAI